MTTSEQKDSSDARKHVVDRFVTAVLERMEDLGLKQKELARRCGNFGQTDVSHLCNTTNDERREPEWKKRTVSCSNDPIVLPAFAVNSTSTMTSYCVNFAMSATNLTITASRPSSHQVR